MENKKKITKFPKGFFQMKRPEKTIDEALKDVIPFNLKTKEKTKNVKKTA